MKRIYLRLNPVLVLAFAFFYFGGVLTASSSTIEELSSLPYITWSKEKVNKNQRGVTKYDKDRAYDGYNLYADGLGHAYLMDMKGRILHRWKFPEPKGNWEYFRLLKNGDIIGVCVLKAAARIDKDSKLIWITPVSTGHDIAILQDGTLLVPSREFRKYKNRRVMFDIIVHLSKDGRPLDQWSTYHHLKELRRVHPPSPLDQKAEKDEYKLATRDYYHLNTIALLPKTQLGLKDKRFQEGNWLICLRNVNLILILDKDTRKIVWSWGSGQLDGPHMPAMLNSGKILIFDNGSNRKYSRLVLVDPLLNRIVWEYKANPPSAFYSEYRGSSQLLPNGNFFICESENGRAFEITPKGEIVWEFFNPIMKNGKRNLIYRMLRISKEEVSAWYKGGNHQPSR